MVLPSPFNELGPPEYKSKVVGSLDIPVGAPTPYVKLVFLKVGSSVVKSPIFLSNKTVNLFVVLKLYKFDIRIFQSYPI